MSSGSVTLPQTGGGSGGGVSSINGDTSANQFIVGTSPIAASTTLGTTTISLGVVPIAKGGTGQSNQQAGLNNLTNVGSGNPNDVLTLSGGNAQWLAPTGGVTSVNGQTGVVNVSVNGSTIPSDASNHFAYSNNGLFLDNLPGWAVDPVNFGAQVTQTIQPNNLGASPQINSYSLNVDPLQNSPNDSMRLYSLFVNLDSSATGFSFGSNGQAGELLGGGYNYGGNGATVGILRDINMFGGFGNGTDPGTFKGISASSHSYNFGANLTIDGSIKGYDFNVIVDASVTTTSNFNVLWLSDFSQYPVDVYGYQGLVCQPNITTIKNGHNFNGAGIQPNITTMEGNAGFYGYSVGGTLGALGTSGFSGYSVNTTIAAIPNTANYIAYSSFSAITTMDAGSNFQGYTVSPTITTMHGNATMFQSNPQVTGGDGNVSLYTGGMGAVHTTGQTSVMNLNGLTADGNQSQFAADSVRMNIGGSLVAASGQGIQSQHVIFTSYTQNGVGAITGTDVLCNILSPDVDFGAITDTLALGPSGLGFNMVGFAGQMHGHGSMALCNSLITGAIFTEDFTVTNYNCVNAVMINAGYTGSCTNATAFYHEVTGAGLFATNHFGLRVVSDIDNYTAKFKMGDGSQKADAAAVLDIESTTKGFLPPRMSTVQKLAIPSPPEGLTVMDITLHQLSYFNGTVWVNV